MFVRTTIGPALSLALAASASAGISQATAPVPGGFGQAAAYLTTCGCYVVDVGNDLSLYGAAAEFNEQAYSGAGPVTVSAAGSTAENNISLSITGTAGMGYASATGSNHHGDFAWFAMAVFDGGWKDTLTVSHPGLNGQQGYLVFRVHARGSFITNGLSGAAVVQVMPYANNAGIPVNPYFSLDSADERPMSGQSAQWALASYGQPDSRNVDGSATFAVPITFGQTFSLGVYARFFAGQRSSGGWGDPSSGTLAFGGRGVSWDGVAGVLTENGSPVAGYSIASGSGTDWTGPYNACPADFNGDGFLDFFDIDAFLAAFESGGSGGDFNHDGFVDFFDADAFVAGFEAGC